MGSPLPLASPSSGVKRVIPLRPAGASLQPAGCHRRTLRGGRSGAVGAGSAHLGGARGRAHRRAPAAGSTRPAHLASAPHSPAARPGGLTRRAAPSPLPQPGRAAGRRGLRAAAAAASPASAAAAPPPRPSPPPASPPRGHAAAAAPGSHPGAPPSPKSGSAPRLGRPYLAPARRRRCASQPLGPARPGSAPARRPPRGRRRARAGAGSAGPGAAGGGGPAAAPPPRAGALPLLEGRAGGPALQPQRTSLAPKSGPGRGSGGERVRAALFPIPRGPAGRVPGSERAPSRATAAHLPTHTGSRSPSAES